MRRITWMALALAGLVACGGGDDDKSGTDTEETTDDASATDSDTEVETNDCEPDSDTTELTGGIYGQVLDTDGEPVGCMRVQLCIEICTVGTTNGAGYFSVETNESGWGGFEVFPQTDTYAMHAAVALPMPVTEGEDYAIDLVMVEYDSYGTIPATATEMDIGGGVTLEIGEDIATVAIGYDSDTLAAAYVPVEARPELQGIENTVLGMWYASPFDTHSEEGMALTLEDWGELDTEMTYEVYEMAIVVGDYTWESAGEITYADGVWTGASLHYLSTFVVVETVDRT